MKDQRIIALNWRTARQIFEDRNNIVGLSKLPGAGTPEKKPDFYVVAARKKRTQIAMLVPRKVAERDFEFSKRSARTGWTTFKFKD